MYSVSSYEVKDNAATLLVAFLMCWNVLKRVYTETFEKRFSKPRSRVHFSNGHVLDQNDE